jgi:2-polyprenyl-6-methoxyphenol hydroxylase-like FAD-dependent oxidoreductase
MPSLPAVKSQLCIKLTIMQGNTTIANAHTPVLIAGGGLTGLTAALFLLQQGIIPVLVERHATTSIHPGARGFDVRTMELFRELQLDDAIREAGKALAPAWGIYQGETLAAILPHIDPQKIKVHHPIQLPGLEKLAALSPVTGARCTQDLSEPVLLQAARERGADIRFNTRLVAFTQEDDRVTARLHNTGTGAETTITCDYMIAADGANSFVRKTLQAATSGAGSLSHLLNIYFEADLAAEVKDREFSICRIEQPGIQGLLTSINNSNKWVFHLYYDPARGQRPEDYTPGRLVPLLKNVLGMPQLPVRLMSVLPWQPTVSVVNNMQHGRIFLAGDAAHQMTPYGGKGAATGVQDVQNLAWKLAMVLRKQAGGLLLHTYSAERQPVGKKVAELSGALADDKGLIDVEKFKFITGGGNNEERLAKMITMTGMPDFEYQSTAVIPAARALAPGLLNGRPGTRVPHVWLAATERKSTLDLARVHFVLITGSNDGHWRDAAQQVATQLKIDLPLYCMRESREVYEAWKTMTNMQDDEAMLVRPDGFVAWRGLPEAGAALQLVQVMKNVLALHH